MICSRTVFLAFMYVFLFVLLSLGYMFITPSVTVGL